MSDNRLELAFHQCLGKGGFGEVYLATVQRPGSLARQMAVKVLREGLSDQNDAVSRLRDEGRMLAVLDHPAILRAHEMVRVSGRVALLTEYVEGIDLARCAKPDKLLPPRVVVESLGEVAGALHVAWSTLSPETGRPLQLIHRDIKPENIRLTVHGAVKLLDFGIARSTEMVRHAQTKVGELPFTPGYAAPEAFRRGEQGPESDVFALGVSMFRLLIGERLFEGMDVGDQFAVASLPEHYEPWLQERLALLTALDRRLVGLVTRMLAYEKSARPTAKQISDACEDLGPTLGGPTLRQWARTFDFPTPKEVKGATLTGKTLKEDPPEGLQPVAGGSALPTAAMRKPSRSPSLQPQPSPVANKPNPTPTPPPSVPPTGAPPPYVPPSSPPLPRSTSMPPVVPPSLASASKAPPVPPNLVRAKNPSLSPQLSPIAAVPPKPEPAPAPPIRQARSNPDRTPSASRAIPGASNNRPDRTPSERTPSLPPMPTNIRGISPAEDADSGTPSAGRSLRDPRSDASATKRTKTESPLSRPDTKPSAGGAPITVMSEPLGRPLPAPPAPAPEASVLKSPLVIVAGLMTFGMVALGVLIVLAAAILSMSS